MNIPESFECAGFTIKIIVKDTVPDNIYGCFNDATNEIHIAKYVKVNGEKVELSNDHIINTVAHEIVHVWQFYYNNEYSEAQAQVYANFICEFLRTKKDNLPF